MDRNNLTVTKQTNKFYCGANTRVLLRQYFNRSIDKRLDGEISYKEEYLDQAVAINFSVQQSREPLYSYADSEFSAMADGKVIVIGKLVTNISDESPSNYIAHILRGMENKDLRSSRSGNRSAPHHLVLENAERIANKINNGAALTDQEINYWADYIMRYGADLGNAVRERRQGRYNTNLIYRDGRADQHNTGFDLIILTGANNEDSLEEIIIKDVTIRSVEQDRAPTDQPLVEVYDFVARTVIYGNS